jgi:DNA polymerase-3 subunit alpha
MEIPPPRLPECEPWQLTVQLDHEKEVTGMFLSGHPLDHYKFEMRHYGVTPIAGFNEFKEAIRMHPNPGRPFRLLGLIADAQHKIARSGNKYGNFVLEDYSGKTEFPLFSDDYMNFKSKLEQGNIIVIKGFMKPRYNKDEFEFKLIEVIQAESMKKDKTKQVTIEAHPQDISKEMVSFVEKNLKNFPGKSTLKFTLTEPGNKMKISLVTMNNGFEMNEEMIHFLEKSPELDVQVLTV